MGAPTAKERQILEFQAAGLSQARIAKKLGISRASVRRALRRVAPARGHIQLGPELEVEPEDVPESEIPDFDDPEPAARPEPRPTPPPAHGAV